MSVTIDSARYRELIGHEENIARILAERQREVMFEEERRTLGDGKVIWKTKDGLTAVEPFPRLLRSLEPFIRRPTRRPPDRNAASCAGPVSPNTEVRNYQFAGKYINGIPVYEEV